MRKRKHDKPARLNRLFLMIFRFVIPRQNGGALLTKVPDFDVDVGVQVASEYVLCQFVEERQIGANFQHGYVARQLHSPEKTARTDQLLHPMARQTRPS